jgi:hypothetical protein
MENQHFEQVSSGFPRNYSKRSMSYDKNALNGILGILGAAWSSNPPIYHFWGIPICPPYRWRNGRRPAKVPGNSAHGFAHALIWHHKISPARRRPKLPSWSWVDWDGATGSEYPYYPDLIYSGCSCTESRVVIFAETRSQQLLNWATLLERLTVKEGLEDLSYVLNI